MDVIENPGRPEGQKASGRGNAGLPEEAFAIAIGDHSGSRIEAPRPLYQKVKNFIEDKIASGHWPPDSRIPSENELVRTLGVSRMTANRALRELAAEGQLVRLQGVGTFVAPRKPQSALLEIRSIADEIRQRGGVHSCEILLLKAEKAPADIALKMGVAAGSPVYHSIMVHRDRGVPIQLADRYVNPAVAPGYLEQDFAALTPSEYLCRVAPVAEVEHVIEAILPDRRMRKVLKIKAGDPCLVLYRTTWSRGVVATVNRLVYPGSRHRIGGRFRPSSSAHPVIV